MNETVVILTNQKAPTITVGSTSLPLDMFFEELKFPMRIDSLDNIRYVSKPVNFGANMQIKRFIGLSNGDVHEIVVSININRIADTYILFPSKISGKRLSGELRLSKTGVFSGVSIFNNFSRQWETIEE